MTTQQQSSRHFKIILLTLCLPVMIACIDLMAISVALNPIMMTYSSSITSTQWILSSYTTGIASTLIISGKLSDAYGGKNVLLFGIVLFLISSLFAGLSTTLTFLIAMRFLQGIATSFMLTTTVAIMTNLFVDKQKQLAIGYWGASLGMGMALGPLTGGLVTHFLSWRYIFFINIPITILSTYLLTKYLPKSNFTLSKQRIDVLSSITLFFFLIAFIALISSYTYNLKFPSITYSIIIIFIILAIVLCYLSFKRKNPLVALSTLKNKNVLSAIFCGFISYFCMYAWLFNYNLYLQNIFHLSALKTGLFFSIFSISFACSSKYIGEIMSINNHKILIKVGFMMIFLNFVLMAYCTRIYDIYILTITFAILGVAITAINAPSIAIATGSCPKEQSGNVSGLMFTIRWLGGSLGILVTAIIFQNFGIDKFYFSTGDILLKDHNLYFILHSYINSHIKYLAAKQAINYGVVTVCYFLSFMGVLGYLFANFLINKITPKV